jgi:hypothetical protein
VAGTWLLNMCMNCLYRQCQFMRPVSSTSYAIQCKWKAVFPVLAKPTLSTHWLLCLPPQVPAASDFLLIRLPSGALQLREISGCVSVGQQHPMRPVWAPGSKEAMDFEDQRLVVGALVPQLH